jgi:hypothetical protein
MEGMRVKVELRSLEGRKEADEHILSDDPILGHCAPFERRIKVALCWASTEGVNIHHLIAG